MILSLLAVFLLTAANPDSVVVSPAIPDSAVDSVAVPDSAAAVKNGETKDSLAVYLLKGMVVTATRTLLAERSGCPVR